ncbi:MAG: EH signature domain-containing protein, partial [Casimicrobiaceae bacterium]
MSTRQMTPLKALRKMLQEAFAASLRHSDGWTDDRANQKMVEKLRARHEGPGAPRDTKTIESAVLFYRRTGQPEGWRGLKRVCFGLDLMVDNGWCIFSDEALRERLFWLAQGQATARKRIKCFQALLSSYWRFPLHDAEPNAHAGWLSLRRWLDRNLQSIEHDLQNERKTVPRWFATLKEHRNLLHEHPCERYAPKLLSSDTTELSAVMDGLGIPSDSWVPKEAVLAQVVVACRRTHAELVSALPNLLKIIEAKGAFELAKSLRRRCVALLVSRYAKVPRSPENTRLRNAAVLEIGNPWLHRASWDAYVVDNHGRPDHAAREMVFRWLKQRLIKDFFELLATDRAGDRRRLDYWLRYEPFIEDMWFALGSATRNRHDRAFQEFRTRAKGRLLHLGGTTPENNAFVMKIGGYLICEFGETGNAFYLFSMDDLPPWISRMLMSGADGWDVEISQLKSAHYAILKMNHRDRLSAFESWEQKFDAEICRLLGLQPKERPAFVPDLESLLKQYQLHAEDKRPKGGAIW